MPEYKNLRVWVKTAENLKLLAAIRKTSVLKLLDELVQKETNAALAEVAPKPEDKKGK